MQALPAAAALVAAVVVPVEISVWLESAVEPLLPPAPLLLGSSSLLLLASGLLLEREEASGARRRPEPAAGDAR